MAVRVFSWKIRATDLMFFFNKPNQGCQSYWPFFQIMLSEELNTNNVDVLGAFVIQRE